MPPTCLLQCTGNVRVGSFATDVADLANPVMSALRPKRRYFIGDKRNDATRHNVWPGRAKQDGIVRSTKIDEGDSCNNVLDLSQFRPRSPAAPASAMPHTADAQFYQLYFQKYDSEAAYHRAVGVSLSNSSSSTRSGSAP